WREVMPRILNRSGRGVTYEREEGPEGPSPDDIRVLAGGSGRVAQGGECAALREVLERVLLDLAHPLGGDAEPAAGLAEGRGLLATEPEAQLHDVALPLGERRHRLLHRGRAGVLDDLVLDGRLLGGDQVAERRLAVLADRLVERRQRTGRLADLDHLVDGQLDCLCDLVLGRLTAELGRELALGAVDLALALS